MGILSLALVPTPSVGTRDGSHRRLAHAAVLVLLAAAARARLVAADLLGAVADRLGLLVALLTVGDRRRLLPRRAVGAGQRPRGRLVRRRPDHPHRPLEALLLPHAEHLVGDL